MWKLWRNAKMAIAEYPTVERYHSLEQRASADLDLIRAAQRCRSTFALTLLGTKEMHVSTKKVVAAPAIGEVVGKKAGGRESAAATTSPLEGDARLRYQLPN